MQKLTRISDIIAYFGDVSQSRDLNPITLRTSFATPPVYASIFDHTNIVIFGFIFTWNNFYVPFLLTGGGPGISTEILITYSYLQAFSYSNYALGAAYAVISIVILLVFVVVANHYTKMMTILD